MNKKKAKRRFVIACMAPACILMLIFIIYPTFNVFRMSLFRMSGMSDVETFIGFENFRILFADLKFIRAMQNTILLISIVTIITMILAILYASLLSREKKLKGQNFFRIVFYIPNILSMVVVAAIFGAIYKPGTGLLNSFLTSINLPDLAKQWTGDSNIVLYSLIGALVWQAIGYYMVMYMAAMSSIPENLYEAAGLEGAGKIKQFFMITLPLVWDNIRTTLTFFIISSINLSFLLVKIMTQGGPNGASEVALNYMYGQAYTNSSYGYGMAIGVMIFLFSFALAGIVNKITEREVLEF